MDKLFHFLSRSLTNGSWRRPKMRFTVWILNLVLLSSVAVADESFAPTDAKLKSIAVENVISDQKIQRRLNDILVAVGSYDQVEIKVVSGVVILSGVADDEQHSEWVHHLAARLEGVVAVQNHIVNRPKDALGLTPAREEIEGFNVALMRHLPTIVLALSVFLVSLFLFFMVSFGFRRILSQKITSPLLLSATARMLSVPLVILGLYLALRISGLAGLAFTVLGGTGILGLILGLGLKNSFEDYASSILLSIKKPFRPNDWVLIGDYEGIVQQVTSRSTLIIDFTGNHILMPNSLVYKSIITNKTANPKMRCDFVFGLDYDDPIEKAQAVVMDLLTESSFVLKDPEPWVLVDGLDTSTINLRVYFWLNACEVSTFKVTSYLLLAVKNRLVAKGFHFPDPQREIVFTNRLLVGRESPSGKKQPTNHLTNRAPHPKEVRAEASELNRLARESDFPDQGESVI